ncbi:MAG: class I tRNA ligase family protein, partial [Nanoarchaeota archaeon]|nr:class I tRNA ligase family protein [Nanoarchaeota archaeon]
DFLKLYPAESLRLFYANHLDRKVIDVDINFADFIALNNNVLMGNLGNFCYRVLTFAQKNYGDVTSIANEPEIISHIQKQMDAMEKNYSNLDIKSALKNVLKIADIGNAYFQNSEVWKHVDEEKSKSVVGLCLNIARILSIAAAPILPLFSAKVQHAFGEKDLKWNDIHFNWKGNVAKVDLLVQKIEHLPPAQKFPLQMVVGKILSVKDHPNADSLYLLQVDLGTELGQRQVVAGLKKHLAKDLLVNRQVVFCANLKPAKIRGELSQAMIMVADDGENVAPLEVQKTKVGEEVHFESFENSVAEITFDEFKKLELYVKGARVFFDGKKLVSKSEEVICHGVKEGTRIY